MREANVCLDLFLGWLEQDYDRRFRVEESEDLARGALSVLASDGSRRLAVEVHPLLDPPESAAWLASRDELEQEIGGDLPGAFALWLPPGADLPSTGRHRRELGERVREVAATLQPGERSFVALPIALRLRKLNDEGGVVEVAGGLNPYWARFTDRVRGTYALDSTPLHRLPESEEHLEGLLEAIVSASQELQTPGQMTEIETIDAWTIQRLEGEHGLTILGVPPQELPDIGLAVRRNFRRILADSAPRLGQREAAWKALVVLGYYAHLGQEGATTALRGYDPTLYMGLDFVCLAVDGLLKPLIQAPAALRS